MYKKFKIPILVIAGLILSSTRVSATTITRTIKGSLVDSSEQKGKIILSVPYATSIDESNIQIDNGKVGTINFDKSTGKLTIEVIDGKTHQILNPYKYPKSATATRVETSKSSLPSSVKVTSGDYSGNISRTKIEDTQISKTVTGIGNIVENWYYECLIPGTLEDNPNFDSSKPDSNSNPKKIYTRGKWTANPLMTRPSGMGTNPTTFSITGTDDGTIKSVYYSDSDGYSGSGSAYNYKPEKSTVNTDYYTPTSANGWKLDYTGQEVKHYSISHRYTLEATVYKDAYKGYYEGYIYKEGYDDVYTYNVTVPYEEDVIDIFETHSTEWTNKDLPISLSSKSYFFNYFDFDGLIKRVTPSTYNVSKNGTYYFSVKDYGHGQSIRNKTISIIIKNIDKDNPYGTFSPNSRTSWDGDITVTFNPLDIGGSGVKRWRYCVSTNDGSSYGSYSNYYTSESKILLNVDGKNKIKVEIEDIAGNIAYSYSGSYYVDKTPPSLTFSPDGCEWRNTSITSNWSATDTGSLVKGYKFRVKNVNGSSTTTTDWSALNISNTKILVEKEGYTEVEVIAEDNAGNSKTYISKQFKVDKSAPTLTVNVESFIKDTFKEIPINLSDVKDNLVGVKNMELSLFKDFSKTINVSYVSNKTSYDILLPRYGLSFDQTLYVKITDLLGNTRTYTKNIYLDPLPPEVPNLISPVGDILIVNSEKLNVEWDYEDPGSFKLLKTDLIFKNKETGTITIETIDGEDISACIEPTLKAGVYDLTVKVYNTENKFTESTTSAQVRKNRFKVQGDLYSKEIIVTGKPIKFIKIDLDAVKQDIPNDKANILSYADIYIVLPDDNGTFNITNTKKVLKYSLNATSDAFRIPGDGISKILVLVKMKSDDKEYSRITPWLDKISVSVR